MSVILRNCPHCPAEHSAFKIAWSGPVPNETHTFNCIATCGACHGPICFVAYNLNSVNAPTGSAGNIEPAWHVMGEWPQRTITGAPAHTPQAVKTRYEEGEDAFSRGRWNSAVAMYRSALDIATKGMEGVPSGTFFERLAWLHEHHAITPDIHAWATHVRVEGNAALHEPDQFNKDDATALRFFTEMFLRYVFELPGAVREFRGEPESATPPLTR